MPVSGKHLNIEMGFTATTSQAKKEIQDLQNQLTKLMQVTSKSSSSFEMTKQLQEANKAAASLKAHLEQATNADTGKLDLGLLNKSFKEAGVNLKDYQAKLSAIGPEGSKAFTSMANAILKADVPLKQTNTLLTQFATTLKNTARWQISSSILHGLQGAVQTAFYYAQDLNESLNNIRIVTGQNTEQMAAFASKANEAAKALSTTTTEYTDAALIYYQQGLSDKEVQERTNTTIKMANVARESAQEVSDQMTAVWNNFNKTGDQSAEHFADVMTALGAATASSTDEIAEGLEKFAGIADTVGLSFDYATSALATITATSRESADVVGTALKTIFSRVEGLKLGNTLDDGTDLNKYSQALATIGVSIKDANGELKDMDDILDETGEKWQNLTRDQKMATAQTVAGVRQYNQFMTLMENWDFMQNNLATARDSEGTLQKQADIYAESWEAARDRVTAAAEEIYSQLLDDDFFIDLNNGFAEFLNIISNTIEAIGGLQGVLSTVGFLITKIYGQDLANGIDKFIYNLQNGQKIAERMRAEALDSLFRMTEGSNLEAVYENIGLPQEAYLNNAKNMSEIEKKTAQYLLDQHEIRVQDVITANEQVQKQQEIVDLEKNKIINKAKSKKISQEELENLQKDLKAYQDLAQLSSKMDKALDKALRGGTPEAIQKAFSGLNTSNLGEKLSNNLKGALNTLANATEQDSNKVAAALEKIEQALTEVDSTVGITGPYFKELKTDLESLGLTDEQVATALEKVTGAMYGLGNSSEEASEKERKLNAETERLTNIFNNISVKAMSFGTIIVNLANGLSSVSMAISTIKGLGDIWTDEDMSRGEKILSTITSLGMAIPMVASGFKTLMPSLGQLGVKLALLAGDTATAAMGETILSATNVTLGETFGVAAAGAASLMSIIWPFVAIGAAVAVAAVAIYKAWNKDAEAASKAAETAAELKDQYNEVKTAYDDLKSSLEDYQSAKDALSELTIGTQEWKEAVIELNSQVLDLMDKYPELASYISNVNGQLQISSAGMDAVINSQMEKVQQAYQNQMIAQTDAASKQLTSSITDFQRTAITRNKFLDNSTEFSKGLSEESTNNIVEALRQNNNAILTSAEELASVADITKEEAEALLENRESLENLQKAILEEQATREVQNQELGQTLIEGTEYANSKYADTLSSIIGTKTQELYGDIFDKRYDEWAMTDWDAQKQYAEMMGYQDYKDKGDNMGEYFNGEEWIEISDSVVRTALAENEAREQATSNLQQFSDAIDLLINEIPEIGDDLAKLLSGDESTSGWSENELKKLQNIDGSNIPEETLKTFDKTESEATELINKMVDNIAEGIESAKDNMSSSVRKIFDDLDTSDLEVSGIQAFSNIFQRAIDNSGEGTIEPLKELYNQALDSEAVNEFAAAMDTIDWTSIDESGLEDALAAAGIETDNLNIDLGQLIAQMQSAAEATDAFTTRYAEVHKVMDGLATGDTVSEGDYNTLASLGNYVDDYFTKMLDGTYKLTGDAQEFYDTVQNDLIQEAVSQVEKLKAERDNYQQTLDTLSQNSQSSSPIESSGMTLFEPENFDYVDKAQEMSEAIEKVEGEINEWELAIASTADSMFELNQMLNEGTISQNAYNQALYNLHEAERVQDLDSEEVEKYARYLQQLAKSEKEVYIGGEKLSSEIADNADAAKDMAIKIMRLNKGVDSLSENWENWSDILKNSTAASEEYYQAMTNTQEALSNLLDMSVDYLDVDFVSGLVENAESMQLMEQAAKGDSEAIDELRQKALENMILHLELDDSEFTNKELLSRVQELQDYINNADLELTPEMDLSKIDAGGESLVDAFNDMIKNAGMTKDEVNNMLSGMQLKATYADKPQTTTTEVPVYTTHHQVVSRGSHSVATPWIPGSPTTQIEEFDEVTTTVQTGTKKMTGVFSVPGMSTDGSVPEIKTLNYAPSGGANNSSSYNSGGGKSNGGSKGGGGGGGNSSKSKGKTKSDKKVADQKGYKEDRYYKYNKNIQKVNNELTKLARLEDQAFGEDKIKNLDAQNKQLSKQIKNYKALYKEQKKELKELKNWLTIKYDATFDKDGYIKNYNKIGKNITKEYNDREAYLTKQYNKWQTKHDKGKISDKKWKNLQDYYNNLFQMNEDNYNTQMGNLEKYNNLVNDTFDNAEERAEKVRQIIENNFKAFELKFTAKIELRKAKREWRSFIREMNRTLDSVRLEFSFPSLTGKNGTLTDISKRITGLSKDLNDNISESTQLADIYLNWDKYKKESQLAKANKTLKEGKELNLTAIASSKSEARELFNQTREEVKATFEELTSLMTEAWQQYYDSIDQVGDAFGVLDKRLQRVADRLEYVKELTQLAYGDTAYKNLQEYYTKEEELINGQIENKKQSYSFWDSQFNTALQNRANELGVSADKVMDDVLSWSQDMTTFYDNAIEAEGELNNLVIQRLELLKEAYSNTVSASLQEALKTLTGENSLDDLAESWERSKEYAEEYLDATEKTYNVQTLLNKYDQSIEDNAKDVKAVQKLNKLRQQELDYLSEKNDLTQYDIDMANLRYEIALKEIALEEAQNNKNSMKMTRDAQGNWSYQYVADSDEVENKTQELNDILYNYYSKAKEAYVGSLEDAEELQQTYFEKLQEISELALTDTAAYNSKKIKLDEWYNKKSQKLARENASYQQDMSTASLGVLNNNYKEDAEAFAQLNSDKQILLNNLAVTESDTFDAIRIAVINNYQRIGDKANEVFIKGDKSLSNLSTSAANKLIQVWSTNPNSVNTVMNQVYSNIETAAGHYKDVVEKNTNDITKYYGEVTTEIGRVDTATKTLKDNSTTYLTEIRKLVDDITAAWQEAKKALDEYNGIAEKVDNGGKTTTNNNSNNNKTVNRKNMTLKDANELFASLGGLSGAIDKRAFSSVDVKGGTITIKGKGGPYYIQTTPYAAMAVVGATTQDYNIRKQTPVTYGDNKKERSYFQDINTQTGRVSVYGPNIGRTVTYNNVPKDLAQRVLDYKNGMLKTVTFDTGGYTGDWAGDGKMAMLHQKELVLNKKDTSNILSAVDAIRDISGLNSSISNSIMNSISNMLTEVVSSFKAGTISTNNNADNNNNSNIVIENINAEFPNAENTEEIREAILSLPRLASQYINRNLK